MEVQRADLIAEFIGGIAIKTKKVIQKAQGGVLFVDEAYTLVSSLEKDFGREAVEMLMSAMLANQDENIQNPIFIFAGYKEKTEEFLSLNLGLARRLKNKFIFNDYT